MKISRTPDVTRIRVKVKSDVRKMKTFQNRNELINKFSYYEDNIAGSGSLTFERLKQ